VTIEQHVRAPGRVKVSYGYRYDFSHVFDPNPVLEARFIDIRTHTPRLNGAVVIDRRDDPFNAQRGWFHSSNLEYSSPAIGSDLRFVKYLMQASYFRPAGAAVVASNVRIGGVRAFEQEVILTERFFAGGSDTVRGYGKESLGGFEGGNALLVLNEEVRFPVYRWIRAVGFVDAGNAFPLISDVRLGGLKVGVGLGTRIETPFGLFRVDFGVPVPRPERGPRGRWYFSLGHVF
jgi:outer membrane translocation and assembly module TamA